MPPRRSTLFPYTTLFRSIDIGLNIHAQRRFQLAIGGWNTEQYMEATDRKSTRLNSSHLGISYAVFCLKKKKFTKYPKAKQFKDFRVMLDKIGKEIDALVI